MNIKNLFAAITIISLVTFVACKKDKFVEAAALCPLVISTNPADGATGVPLNQVITATFNEKMNPATITDVSFTVVGSIVKGKVTYTDSTASFTPDSALILNHTYTGHISTSVKDLMGNALQKEYVWSFSTGVVPAPLVLTTDPVNNATGVVLNKIITVNFNMPMDSTTVNNSTFKLDQGANSISGVVSGNGSNYSFKPNSALLSNTLYKATITKNVKNTAGISMAADYVWTFTTGNLVAPFVVSTDPTNNAAGVALNKVVSALFSTPMDAATLNNSSFYIKQGLNAVSGTIGYSGSTVTFTPTSNFLAGTVYTCTITTGAKNLAGTGLANDYTWSFTTLTPLAPTVISTDPANNETNVVLNKTITATFSVPMDPTTINNSTFTLKNGTTTVAGSLGYSGSSLAFIPTTNLQPGTVYTATITTGAKNLAGTPLASNYVWTFTTLTPLAPTVISTDPADNETGVVLTKVISATFSVPMDPLTLTNASFTVKNGTTSVSGSIGYSGSTVAFVPTVKLLPNTVYTCTITTAAKNVAGTPMAADYVWSFTTEVPTPPTVISTDPANNATSVPLNKVISATFSVPMDAATLNINTFKLKLGSTAVSGVITYSGSTAYFTPNVLLLSGNTYTATITTGAQNVAGTAMAADYVWTFTTKDPLGPISPDLKSAGNFGILAGTGISNNAGFSIINDMDVGISPGVRSSITGFGPAVVVNGAIYASDDASPAGVAAMLIQAKQDLTDVYLYAEGATSPAPATVSGDQGGKTLAPGIYKSTSTLLIQNGNLTLDAQGDVNAVWIFQVASGFTTVGGAGGSIILSGGAKASNVYWQVGSSATIGDYTSFKGNILALTSITMNSHAVADGRMLARNSDVVLTSTNIINKP